jgi:hypothetical protein
VKREANSQEYTREAVRDRLASEARDLARDRGHFAADIVSSHLASRRRGRLILMALGCSAISLGLFGIRALLAPGASCLLCG